MDYLLLISGPTMYLHHYSHTNLYDGKTCLDDDTMFPFLTALTYIKDSPH